MGIRSIVPRRIPKEKPIDESITHYVVPRLTHVVNALGHNKVVYVLTPKSIESCNKALLRIRRQLRKKYGSKREKQLRYFLLVYSGKSYMFKNGLPSYEQFRDGILNNTMTSRYTTRGKTHTRIINILASL